MPTIDELNAIIEWWEFLDYLAIGLIGFGVVLEYVPEFFPHGKIKGSHRTFVVAGIGAILLGLGAEILCNHKASSATAQIVARLQHETAIAIQRASEADLQRARLEQRLAPRALPSDGQKRVAIALRLFANVEFDARVFQDPESLNLLPVVLTTLKDGGWRQLPITAAMEINVDGFPACGMSLEPGIHVRFDPSQSERLGRAARELVAALTKEGLEASWEEVTQPFDPTRLHVVVGKKPST